MGSSNSHSYIALLDLKDRKGESVKPSKPAEEVDSFPLSGLQGTERAKSHPGDTPGNPEPKRATRNQLSTLRDYYKEGSFNELADAFKNFSMTA